MIDMSDNCLMCSVLYCRVESPIEVSRWVESFCILKTLCIRKRKRKENNITVSVSIFMSVVIKFWFLCHFNDDTRDQYIWYTLIYVWFWILEFYAICMFGVTNKCVSFFMWHTGAAVPDALHHHGGWPENPWGMGGFDSE